MCETNHPKENAFHSKYTAGECISNAITSGSRKWKQIFDHQAWVQKLPRTNGNHYFAISKEIVLDNGIFPKYHIVVCTRCSMSKLAISIIFLSSYQCLYPGQMVKYVFPLSTTRVIDIFYGSYYNTACYYIGIIEHAITRPAFTCFNILCFNILFPNSHCNLTHCGLVMPYGDIDLGQHWLR